MSYMPCYSLFQENPDVSILRVLIWCPPVPHAERQNVSKEEISFDELFELAFQLPEHVRSVFLEEACKGRPELKRRLETLLEGSDKIPPEEFLDPKALIRFVLDKLGDEPEIEE